MPASKTIYLCADDYGYNPAVSSAIRHLIENQRLNATSCMVNMPDFPAEAKALLALSAPIFIGLHLDFTEGNFLSAPTKPVYSLKKLILIAHTRLIDKIFIEQEIRAQLDRFEAAFGCPPDFIDGHQHIHQLPVIRNILLKIYKERLPASCQLRNTFPVCTAGKFWCKSGVIAATGGWYFSRMLKKDRIPHNPQFSGIYNFSPDCSYRMLFKAWLTAIQDNVLIMCHPGLSAMDSGDSIAQARSMEYNYLSSNDFLQDCIEANVILKCPTR